MILWSLVSSMPIRMHAVATVHPANLLLMLVIEAWEVSLSWDTSIDLNQSDCRAEKVRTRNAVQA